MEGGVHEIYSQYQFIAVCMNTTKHITGKPHVVCSGCLQNDSIVHTPSFEIKKNFYTYQKKKKRSIV